MIPVKSKSKGKPASRSNAGLAAALVVLAALAVGYLLWPRPAEPAAPKVAARPAPAAPPVPEPPPAPAVAPEPPPFDPAGFGDPAQFQDMRQAMAAQMVDFAYQDLLGQLDLDPAQADRLKGLLGERVAAFQDAMMQAFANGAANGFDPAAFQQIGDQVEAQFADKIRAVVGEDNAQQIQTYDADLRQQFQAGGGGFGGGGFGGGGFDGFPGN
jgi:hypothetical protein